ncbi:MAG TPA: aminopeptidase [Anaeromyxobacteraceae bacterium]|nr:aminopeptidase [Anaeromyxobacteraceae bacterium]
MARSKSKHVRLIMKRRQRWKRRLKTRKATRKAAAKK